MIFEYNEKQQKAIDSKEPNIVIIAPAGSGKSSTLVGAVEKYKEENPFSTVVVITFTRKATEDLEQRLASYTGVSVSTIHSWAYTELGKLAQIVQNADPFNAFKVKVLQEERIKEMLKELTDKKGYYNLNQNQLFYYVMGNYNIEAPDYVMAMLRRINEEYILLKRHLKLYDFTDLPLYLLNKLNDTEREIEYIDALFVDEFQDVDDVQLELLERTKATKKFFIGDFDQSIYMFRGATPDIMKKIPYFKKLGLDVNYRSYQEIIDFATYAKYLAETEGMKFSNIMESAPSNIKCVRGNGGKVYTINNAAAATEINTFRRVPGVDVIKEMFKHTPMILCRTNREVKLIKDLGYNYVSTIHQAKGLEYQSVIVTDFVLDSSEEINIAYVALTRAKDRLLATSFSAFYKILKRLGTEIFWDSLF